MNVPKKVFGDLHSFNLRISKKQVYYAGHDEAVAGLPSPLSGVCLSGSANCDYESSFPEFHDVDHSSGSILRLVRISSQRLQAWLLPGFLGVLAVIGLVLLYSELRRAARLRRRTQRSLVRFPEQQNRRKAS